MTDPKMLILNQVSSHAAAMQATTREIRELLDELDSNLAHLPERKAGKDIRGWATCTSSVYEGIESNAAYLDRLGSMIWALGDALTWLDPEAVEEETESFFAAYEVPPDELGVYVEADGTVGVDSLDLAKNLSMDHDKLVHDIDELLSPEYGLNVQDWFDVYVHQDRQHGQKKCYKITRDGFGLLPLNNTGESDRTIEKYLTRMSVLHEQAASIKLTRAQFKQLSECLDQCYHPATQGIYIREFHMLYEIALGMPVEQFRAERNMSPAESIWSHLTEKQIADIYILQKMDAGLVLGTRDFEVRKRILTEYKENVLDKETVEIKQIEEGEAG